MVTAIRGLVGALAAAVVVTAVSIPFAASAAADAQTAYLEKNKRREGVQVTRSGLQFRILREGRGRKPKATDFVEVHYRGRLVDGTVFDSSYRRGKPSRFQLNGVIPGWTEGVQLMQEGAKYEFVIPARLAYGRKGAGDVVPPNATLIFQVELLRVL